MKRQFQETICFCKGKSTSKESDKNEADKTFVKHLYEVLQNQRMLALPNSMCLCQKRVKCYANTCNWRYSLFRWDRIYKAPINRCLRNVNFVELQAMFDINWFAKRIRDCWLSHSCRAVTLLNGFMALKSGDEISWSAHEAYPLGMHSVG